METDNIFADQMEVRRPIFFKQGPMSPITVITQTGYIIGQRIQPNISHMFGVKTYRNTPSKRSAGYTQILQAWQQEIIHHLVFS